MRLLSRLAVGFASRFIFHQDVSDAMPVTELSNDGGKAGPGDAETRGHGCERCVVEILRPQRPRDAAEPSKRQRQIGVAVGAVFEAKRQHPVQAFCHYGEGFLVADGGIVWVGAVNYIGHIGCVDRFSVHFAECVFYPAVG